MYFPPSVSKLNSDFENICNPDSMIVVHDEMQIRHRDDLTSIISVWLPVGVHIVIAEAWITPIAQVVMTFGIYDENDDTIGSNMSAFVIPGYGSQRFSHTYIVHVEGTSKHIILGVNHNTGEEIETIMGVMRTVQIR